MTLFLGKNGDSGLLSSAAISLGRRFVLARVEVPLLSRAFLSVASLARLSANRASPKIIDRK